MIPATQLQYEYVKALNRVNSDWKKSVAVVDRDAYLNEAKDIVLENYAQHVEINPEIRNHLRQLIKRREELELVDCTDDYCKFKLPKNFYRLLRQTTVASRKNCTADCPDRELLTYMIQSDDISESQLRDPYNKPSYNWKETFAIEEGNNIMVYKYDELDIKKFIVDYMEKIPDIATPSLLDCSKGYRDAKGNVITGNADFLIDSTFIWRKVVAVAVLNTTLDFGQVDDYQAKLSNILQLENLYIT